jgi:hypothetical protein
VQRNRPAFMSRAPDALSPRARSRSHGSWWTSTFRSWRSRPGSSCRGRRSSGRPTSTPRVSRWRTRPTGCTGCRPRLLRDGQVDSACVAVQAARSGAAVRVDRGRSLDRPPGPGTWGCWAPRTELVTGQINPDDEGYILVEGRSTRTNLPGVFAGGDVVDHTPPWGEPRELVGEPRRANVREAAREWPANSGPQGEDGPPEWGGRPLGRQRHGATSLVATWHSMIVLGE